MKILAQTILDSWEDQLGQIENSFYNAGYDFKVDDENGLPKITIASTIDSIKEDMPTINVETHDDEGIYFTCEVSFPELYTSEHDPADHVEYCLENWQKVGRLITELCSIVLESE